MTRPANVPARSLAAGEPRQRSFDEETPHAYEVEVAAGDLLRVTTEQRGVDVEVRLFAPDGRPVMVMDSPTGEEGSETVSAVAESAGTWRVEVHPDDHGPGAGYEIRVDDLRPAGDEDRRRVEAEQGFARGEELRRKDEYAAAQTQYQRALQGFRSLGDLPGEARALYRIGWMLASRNEHRKAVERFELAADRFRTMGDPVGELNTLNRLGATLRRDGNLKPAIGVHRRAEQLSRQLDDPERRASALDLLGDAYRFTRRFGAAIDAYRQALDLWTAQDDRHRAARTWYRIGELYVYQDSHHEARDAFERALDLTTDDDRHLRSLVFHDLGTTDHRAGRPDAARRHLERALELAEASGEPRARLVAHSSLGTLALEQQRLDECEKHLDVALALSREIGDPVMEGWMLHKQGRHRFAEARLGEAMELHRRAEALFKRSDDRQGLASTRYAIARIHHRQGDYTAASEVLESTLRSADELRSDAEGPDLQVSYVDFKHHYWELYVDTLVHLEEAGHLGAADRALAVTETWRARGLVEMLEVAGVDMEHGVDERLLEKRESVQRRLNAVELQLLELLDGDEAERQRLQRQRMELLRELRHVRSEIRRSNEVQRRLNPASDLAVLQSSAVSDVQQWHLGPHTAVLVYALGDERSFGWTVTVEESRHHVLPPRGELEELAGTAAELLQSAAAGNAERRDRALAALSDAVLVPLLDDLGEPRRYRRLIVVADGALLRVPFATLPLPAGFGEARDERPPALRHYQLVHLPSLATLVALRGTVQERRRAGRVAPHAAAVIADPVLSADDPRIGEPVGPDAPTPEAGDLVTRSARDVGLGGFRRLPATAREAELIERLMPGDVRGNVLLARGFDADREMVLAGALGDYRILHFATHGLLNQRHPELSGLVLSLFDRQGRPRDGFLRLHEIYDLRLTAELAVLSACETGLGREYRGEGMVGLTRGFMYAGVPRVVVSLWKVDDESTAELMWRFYHLLLDEHLAPAAALRRAQLSMLDDPDWSAPHHWAGFVFLGDPTLRYALDDPIEKKDLGTDEEPDPGEDDDLPIPDLPQRPRLPPEGGAE